MIAAQRPRATATAVRQVISPAWLSGLTVGPLATAGITADAYTAATLSRILVVGLLAASVTVLVGWCGLPSLGQVAPFAAGAYTAAILARHHQTGSAVQLAAAALAGAVVGTVLGLVTSKARGTVYLMVTLAMAELVAIAAVQAVTLTGGSDGLSAPAITWWSHRLVDDRQVYLHTLAVVTIVVTATMLLLRSPAGLLLRAARDNETRLRTTGHPVGRYLLAAHLSAGILAGIGGALLATTQRYISPADAGFDLAALVLLAVIIGGATSLPGAFVAAALIVVTRDWLAGPWPGHAPLFVGVLLVATVYLLPRRGLSGLVATLRGLHQGKVTR